MKNYLSNMFANIKNGQLCRKHIVYQKRKKICEKFLKILWLEGYILGYSFINKNSLKIFLKYKNKNPCIYSLKLISKPGRCIYYSSKQIWKINSSKSFIIFSTNQGLKSIVECKKLGIGGQAFLNIN